MAHEFVYFEAKGTVVRACKFCTCSSVLIGTQKDMSWETVLENDGTQIMSDEECGEKPVRDNTTKQSAAQRRAAAMGTKKYEPCYCDDCKGKKSHYVDSSDCYCRGCKGRKTHY